MTQYKMLVTGGAGFIGGNFIHYMMERYPDYEIFNLDVLTYAGDLSKHENIHALPNYHFVYGDISNKRIVMELFEKHHFDYVVHFAAESDVDRFIQNPSPFMQSNIMGTQNLLEAARKYGIEKFIHISTDKVYGALDFETKDRFVETTPLNSKNPYSASKAASDLIALSYYETYKVPVIVSRCTNNYGPYQLLEKLIPLTITNAIFNQAIPLYAEGQDIRDWIHVCDHVSAIDCILHNGKVGEVYNVGSTNERTNLQVVQNILQILGKSEELITFTENHLAHEKRYAVYPQKLAELGWKAHYTFEEGLSDTVDWYLLNQNWWEHLKIQDMKRGVW